MRRSLLIFPYLALMFSLGATAQQRVISSLGRLEPENGVVQLAGPSGGGLTAGVIKSLEVSEGDWVDKDQVVARMDSYKLREVPVDRVSPGLHHMREVSLP